MSQFVDGPTKTMTVNGAIGEKILVKLASGKVAIAGLADEPIGATLNATFADGDEVAVVLLNKQGTIPLKSAAAIVQGVPVYGRANGLIDDVGTSSAVRVGIAMEAAAAANDIIEVLPDR